MIWEDAVEAFLDKYSRDEPHTDSDMIDFVEQGLKPLVQEYAALREASGTLVDCNLRMFKKALARNDPKVQGSKTYLAMQKVLEIVQNHVEYQ